ncbi:hypothetical protein PBY51_023310 [Eleginops maclovinus]|uniref:Uncharacterized protein n=1 Tax=Eleginops maclovinus TaxID=56733 RepID=A0AAN8ADY9_ELEMC|nr:hypothetical protein PBY51_023310 [Eleginops maclovinus]
MHHWPPPSKDAPEGGREICHRRYLKTRRLSSQAAGTEGPRETKPAHVHPYDSPLMSDLPWLHFSALSLLAIIHHAVRHGARGESQLLCLCRAAASWHRHMGATA